MRPWRCIEIAENDYRIALPSLFVGPLGNSSEILRAIDSFPSRVGLVRMHRCKGKVATGHFPSRIQRDVPSTVPDGHERVLDRTLPGKKGHPKLILRRQDKAMRIQHVQWRKRPNKPFAHFLKNDYFRSRFFEVTDDLFWLDIALEQIDRRKRPRPAINERRHRRRPIPHIRCQCRSIDQPAGKRYRRRPALSQYTCKCTDHPQPETILWAQLGNEIGEPIPATGKSKHHRHRTNDRAAKSEHAKEPG